MLRVGLVLVLCLMASAAEARRHRYPHQYHRMPWCGLYLGQYLGKLDRRLWVAREWAREGADAGGPDIGVVVVWAHHVGIIEGRASNGMWVIRSGNDGNAVRVRPLSVARAIAFRRV